MRFQRDPECDAYILAADLDVALEELETLKGDLARAEDAHYRDSMKLGDAYEYCDFLERKVDELEEQVASVGEQLLDLQEEHESLKEEVEEARDILLGEGVLDDTKSRLSIPYVARDVVELVDELRALIYD